MHFEIFMRQKKLKKFISSTASISDILYGYFCIIYALDVQLSVCHERAKS